MLNVTFGSLKGLSSSTNAKILRNMGEDFREPFTKSAMEVFALVNELSGKKMYL